jgi:hypothetical protein
VVARDEQEILLDEDDCHLDFRLSLRLEPMGPRHRLTVSTAVHFHGRAGRLYFLPVGPLHRVIVPAMMRRMTRHVEAIDGRGGVRPLRTTPWLTASPRR